MQSSDKENFIESYSNKILGVRNYKSEKKEFYTDDLINIEVLEDFLEEVFNSESDITPAGKSFLEKYYGFDKLTENIIERGRFSFSSESATFDEIYVWLKELHPMETMTFIEESRGNIKDVATLRPDLLPPENL